MSIHVIFQSYEGCPPILADDVSLSFFWQDTLKKNKFTSEFLIKLVSITLFVLWNIKTGGADELEEFECIGKDEEVNTVNGNCWCYF